jgi:hypothetical protein
MSGYGVPPGASGPRAGLRECHHAGCVITRRIRALAGAILAAALIASDSLRH